MFAPFDRISSFQVWTCSFASSSTLRFVVNVWKEKGQSVSKANILHLFHLFSLRYIRSTSRPSNVRVWFSYARVSSSREWFPCEFQFCLSDVTLMLNMCAHECACELENVARAHIHCSQHVAVRIVINEKTKLVKHKDLLPPTDENYS